MASVSVRRQGFRKLLIAMLVVDAVALVYLLSPLGESRAKRQERREQILQELQVRKREVAPLKDIDQKLVVAGKEIADFYDQRFPSLYSTIPDQLGKLATENNVRISAAKYGPEDVQAPGVKVVAMEANLDGNYLQIVKFINALERDKTLFIVNSVALSEVQGGTVKLTMKMEAYLKS
jgi:Tfp pilus assembly protein PilO